jgi:hypothetical protein
MRLPVSRFLSFLFFCFPFILDRYLRVLIHYNTSTTLIFSPVGGSTEAQLYRSDLSETGDLSLGGMLVSRSQGRGTAVHLRLIKIGRVPTRSGS